MISWETIIPLLFAGLLLFLYSIRRLSKILRKTFSDRATQSIERYTKNLFFGIVLGTFFTFLLGSSSAVIIIIIIFINAETMTFERSVGPVMGANIGTTFSSQIIALDVGEYALVPFAVGLVIFLFAKTKSTRRVGKVVLYLGMLFFGLFLMEESVVPLKDSNMLEVWMTEFNNPVKGVLLGGLITLIIQSSSATVAIAITLGKQQLISLSGGIAVMLGAELGTCSDTMLATIRGKRQALKAGLFHLSFNLITIVVGLVLFNPFMELIKWISLTDVIDNQIANAHFLFNTLGVLFFIPIVRPFIKFWEHLLPEKTQKQ
ncbi:MAG: Na/Pi symporter [Cyclobacteriaceae bacterium]